MMSVTSPAIPGYRLDAPTEAWAVDKLAHHVGRADAEHLWREAKRAAGVPAPGREGRTLSVEELKLVAKALSSAESGAVGVFAKSLDVRLTTYILLAKKAAAHTRIAV